MEEQQYVKINKRSLRGFLVGFVIAAPIFIGGTYLFSDKIDTPSNPDPNDNPPANEQKTPEFKIDKSSHTRGNEKAKAQLVLYSDFQCPYCANHHKTIKQVIEKYGDDVFVAFKHFPLSFHEYAEAAAGASECAAEQGKFWEYADKLFTNQEDFANEPWLKLAKELGLNENDFTSCINSEKYKNKINEDVNEGYDNGVEGTPATFVNGELISGALPFSNFEQIVDSFLK